MVAELEKSRQSRMDLEVEPIGLAARLNMGVESKVKELKISFSNLYITSQDKGHHWKGSRYRLDNCVRLVKSHHSACLQYAHFSVYIQGTFFFF